MTRDRADLELLADLDAGVLDEAQAARVRAAALADPTATAMLDALAATRADLAALPPPPLPPEVGARWAAALRATASGAAAAGHPESTSRPAAPGELTPPGNWAPGDTATPGETATSGDSPAAEGATPLGEHASPHLGSWHGDRGGNRGFGSRPPAAGSARRRRRDGAGRRPGRRGWRPRPAVVTAAVLLAVLAGAALQPWLSPRQQVGAMELASVGRAAIGVGDSGELVDPTRRVGCLRSVSPPGLAPDAPLLGGRQVSFEGNPATLLVLGTGELGTFQVVMVNPDCGPQGGRLLGSVRVGR